MHVKYSKRLVHIKWFNGHYTTSRMQMAIIFVTFLISALISLWLPIYFAMLALRQGL